MSNAIFGIYANNLFVVYLKFKFNWVYCILSYTLGRRKAKVGRRYELDYLKFVSLNFYSSDSRFAKRTSVYNLTFHEELATGKE